MRMMSLRRPANLTCHDVLPNVLFVLLAQVLPLQESVMAPAGPAEVLGAGSVSVGRTQTDRLLRILPKTGTVSMNQLRLAACIAGQDEVSSARSGSSSSTCQA